MKTYTTHDAETSPIEGTVIDPTTKRLCATAADITRATGASPATLSRLKVTRHAGGRYLDILQTLAELAKERKVGRPRRAMAEHGEVSLALAAAVAITAMIISVCAGGLACGASKTSQGWAAQTAATQTELARP